MPRIRPAAPADAAPLARFAERVFRHSHAGDSAQADLDAYVAGHFGPDRQLAEISDPDTTFFLAEHEGRIVGYLQLRRRRAMPGATADPAEFAEAKRVYVDAAFQGTGLAQRLMAACADAARAAGASRLWLSVWQQNHRAIAFYRKAGFEIAGEAQFQVGREIQQDWIMVRPC